MICKTVKSGINGLCAGCESILQDNRKSRVQISPGALYKLYLSLFMNTKDISKWIRNIVVPDHEAHQWEREQVKAQILKDEQELAERKKRARMD
ncbi:MAG: hypothetical protein ABIH83_00775 [Candidatus Micrarchaeota archaeon]